MKSGQRAEWSTKVPLSGFKVSLVEDLFGGKDAPSYKEFVERYLEVRIRKMSSVMKSNRAKSSDLVPSEAQMRVAEIARQKGIGAAAVTMGVTYSSAVRSVQKVAYWEFINRK